MKDLQNLKEIGNFLIEHEDEFGGDEIFGIIFPVIYNELNERDDIDNLFTAFLNWWNKNSEFRLINNDVEITNKFIEYYKGVYQLILNRNKVTEQWIKEGIIDKDFKYTHGESDFLKNL